MVCGPQSGCCTLLLWPGAHGDGLAAAATTSAVLPTASSAFISSRAAVDTAFFGWLKLSRASTHLQDGEVSHVAPILPASPLDDD